MRLLNTGHNSGHIESHSESGQTLIETMMGIFILITALSSGLGLAIYALSASSNSSNQLIASNLAREGVEVARMMRDTNWMAAPYAGSGNHLQNCTYRNGVVELCFPRAFVGPEFDLDSSGNDDDYRFVMRNSPTFSWDHDRRNGNETYLICLQDDGTYQHDTLGVFVSCSGTLFARQVQVLTGRTSAPYTAASSSPSAGSQNHSPEKIIRSTVIWRGRGCAPFDDFQEPSVFTNTACRIVVEERLTNWRDYR